MKTIVVSGINIFRGGTLKIMQECIAALSGYVGDGGNIIALVHDENLFLKYDNVRYVAFPKSRRSWFIRLYYEYIGFRRLSKNLKPYLWLSMHDTTPNVVACRRAVYCHNPFPFYRPGIRNIFLQPGIAMLCLFSYFIYRINIRRNDFVIVQQEWLRHEFRGLFGIDNIIVSPPGGIKNSVVKENTATVVRDNANVLFFYPSTPMIHKNMEAVCEAAFRLTRAGVKGFEVAFTFDGTENRYAKHIFEKYHDLAPVRFIGALSRDGMNEWYAKCDSVIFPSKVETWGLPVSEAKEFGKPVIVADLPYARETVGDYGMVKFFDPDEPDELAMVMRQFISGKFTYDPVSAVEYGQPFAGSWEELFNIILK
ncbi:MAG: glycosyltransferase [Dysgonamonadaceae bacterium]|jgi:glycosyltransferase involved in cell wall biosynthesis|nr:glycosyltransferase [Dysgonamonadaceae bacterium]